MSHTIFLHLGLHKKASKNFQETCQTNQKQLKKQGFIFPLFPCSQANKLEISNHSIPIRSAVEENPIGYAINQIWGIANGDQATNSHKRQIAKLLNSCENIFLNSEGIFLLIPQHLVNSTYFAKGYDYDVKARGFARSPFESIASVYQEMIKDGNRFPLICFGDFTTLYLTEASQKLPTQFLQKG